MKQFPYILSFIMMMISCSSSEQKEGISPNIPPTNMDNTNIPKRTYLALGDSYTIGQNVPESDRWSAYLCNLVKPDFGIPQYDIIARTGWTTEELIDAINDRKLSGEYDLVSLLIGVNNQYRGQSIEKYRIEFRELLRISTKYAKNEPQNVVVLSIPDWGVTPFAGSSDKQKIASEIDKFNAVAQEEGKNMKIAFVNITDLSRTNIDASMIASDQLHFSGKMHELWAKAALPTVKNILK
ncbi:SGNH/GDSL hydrolase family protein [Arcicella sp. LKC2W]|uniref:SGNH/GDSL hydrolase family protein n=1 Tax=Arcicella sp. LKC2W TaxID=2984198 RepID=UPI002B2213BF|nr:SGNH/GDSL hydrolase family protein [Arcicella sp. LKC2W]MEA5459989.1 SGNH/GDSL hydrolase family protein [Arcicella sp. LKC2W]